MSDEYTIQPDNPITRLEKRGKGFRRLITAINDLPLYGIVDATHPNLIRKLESLKDYLKTEIGNNNTAIANYYTPTDDKLETDPLKEKIVDSFIERGTT